jgi:hypothetical protein
LEHGVSTLSQALIAIVPTAAWPFVAVALIALGIIIYIALRSRTHPVDLEKTVEAFRSLDIEAFRNLVDPGEDAFLRNHLSPKKFREIKRQRAWAALLYAWEAGTAATALAKLGQAAQRSLDPKIAASGVQLSENAFRLRVQTIRACLHLLPGILLPGLQTNAFDPWLDQYERTSETLLRLRRAPRSAEFMASRSA